MYTKLNLFIIYFYYAFLLNSLKESNNFLIIHPNQSITQSLNSNYHKANFVRHSSINQLKL